MGVSFVFNGGLREVSAQRRSEQAISRKKAAKARNVATYQTMVMMSMAVCDNSLEPSCTAKRKKEKRKLEKNKIRIAVVHKSLEIISNEANIIWTQNTHPILP